MSAVFDKLNFTRTLESEGTFARPQAEKLSDAVHNAIEETVATRSDIGRLESRIDVLEGRLDAKLAGVDAKLAGVEARLDAKLAGVEARLSVMDAKVDAKLAGVDAQIAQQKVWIVGVGLALFTALSAIRFFGH